MSIKKLYENWKRKKIIKILTSSSPLAVEHYGEGLLLPAFHRAAAKMPAYAELLKQKNVKPCEIKTIDDFKRRVPIFTKKDFFADTAIDKLCVNGDLGAMSAALSSSGSSGNFSFGAIGKGGQRNTAFNVDTTLEYVFKISRKKTFLVNCLAMGVRIPTSLPQAETGPRADTALAIIKKFSPHFEQILIAGDPHFLKKLVEDGTTEGINWKQMNVSLITGGDWFSESFRSYLAELLGIDFSGDSKGIIGATFGIAELDLNLFHETMDTIRIRRHLQENPALKKVFFPDNPKITPLIFHYYPHRVFLEVSDEKKLVFSMLGNDFLIPLIRYNSGDTGYIFSYEKIRDILVKHGFTNLIPELKLPLAAVSGRQGRYLAVDEKKITPEEIKEGLYSNFEAASATTGYFRLTLDANQPKLEIQLKKGVTITENLKNKFNTAALKYVDAGMPITLYPYQDFPCGMELDYERKFKNI